MTAIPYWHVDAFADRPFTGNQAAVMPLESWLDDATLLAIAAENMFAETAFLVRDSSGASDYELRWFTPTCEIRLCGHATLAAGFVLLSVDGFLPEGADKVRFATRKAGILEVKQVQSGGYEVALPANRAAPSQFPEAVALLGGSPSEVWRHPDRYNIFLYDSEDEVRALKPDFKALAQLGDDSFSCTARGTDTDIVSRVFVPGAGVDEDAVTGSAHSVLTPFWTERLGRDHFTAYQASERGGFLQCRLDGEQVWLGGQCVTVVEGKFFV